MTQRDIRSRPATSLSRRRFLYSAGALCGVAGSLASLPVLAHAAPATRSLRLVHTHTGEALTTRYAVGGVYDEAALAELNWLLRDFRSGESHPIDPSLLDILYDLQALANHDAPYEVISGYRSPNTNAMLRRNSTGVAEHSQHLLGKAIDLRLSGYPTLKLGAYARSLSRGGVGFYARSDFIHVDTGPLRSW